MVTDLGRDDLLLGRRQQPFHILQGQAQISDIAEVIGPVDFHDVHAPPLALALIFTNLKIHATRSPEVKDRPENARIARRPQNLRQSPVWAARFIP
jgi:hypothetical protein